MITIDYLLFIASILIIISILFTKLLDNVGIPTLLLFIGVGILAGSEGIGGIYFNNTTLAQSIGIMALVFILFSGGLSTNWHESKKIIKPAVSLATVGVLITAVTIAVFVMWIFHTSFLWGLLIGSVISSTDAAAVFSILSSNNIDLKNNIKPLLELESGSNDPMAVFLTIGTIELMLAPHKTIFSLITFFLLQMGLGAVIGIAGGRLMVYLTNKLKLFYEGIYPVFTLAMAALVYSLTSVLEGSGFLAVYIAGITMGNSQFIQKKTIIRFFDGLSMLSQISMFLTLGLFVFPSQIIKIYGLGLLLSVILIFLARPLSVYISLLPFKFSIKEKAFISWVGLRGAVPIILATFPLLSGVNNSSLIFNLVFFIVLTSSLLQGWSLNSVAKLLNLSLPKPKKKRFPLEVDLDFNEDADIMEFLVPYNSVMVGKQIVELNFPNECRIVLIVRNENNIIPSGGTVLEQGDVLSILFNKNNANEIKEIFAQT